MEVVIVGEDAPVLVGKQGEVLNSFQFLLSLMIKHRTGRHVRLSLDADGYRAKRAEALVQAAKEMAEQVRTHNEEAVMDPLPASERWVVHNALLTETGIKTYSEGEEPFRRVVISPKD